MATIQLGNGLTVDMRNVQVLYGTVRIASSTQIEITAGNITSDYFGQGFAYSSAGDVVGGTLTGYSEVSGNRPVISATGLSVPATTTYQLVQSNNVTQLLAIALAGDDTLYGAGNNDVLVGYGGSNTFVGIQGGVDYVGYSGASSAYSVTTSASGTHVTRPDGGVDALTNIKAIQFSDKTLSLTSSAGIGSGTAADYQVISATTIGLFRFFSKLDGTHFYTASRSEEQQIAATRSDLTFEGVDLYAVNPSNLASDKQATTVYRFFDTTYGTHFYTINQAEEQNIVATRSDLKLEGTAFYAHTTKQATDSAVYRFFDTNNGTHFYSSSASEIGQIQSSRPDLKMEGVAFYVPTS